MAEVVLLALGSFKFTVTKTAFSELQRSKVYNWARHDRLFSEPTYKFMGYGEQRIELSGEIANLKPSKDDPLALLKDLADKGEPQILIDQSGKKIGKFVILEHRDILDRYRLSADPRRIQFRLTLARFPEEAK